MEELMDIRFKDTQSANASTETLVKVMRGYGYYRLCNPALVREASRRALGCKITH